MRDERRCAEAKPPFLAHSANASGRPQLLADHLRAVSSLAGSFAGAFDASAEAELAGLLHDIGKYGDLFQQRLRGKAHGVDHWSSGAWAALTQLRALAAGVAIQGHHLGLQRLDPDSLRALDPSELVTSHPLGLRLSEASLDTLERRLRSDGLDVPSSVSPTYGNRMRHTASAMLDVRMLYSALVDADFLNTDAHFQGEEWPLDERLLHGPPLDPTRALAILVEHVKNVARSSRASEAVKRIRADVLEACLAAGRLPQGLWTLSAPTGSGKTLAMLAFALQHAVEHNLRRVVMVIPYLTIIEQTAGVYRGILSPQFGEQYIREHHSLAGTREEKEARAGDDFDGDNDAYLRPRALADNWNAPLIVTTSVQFLESLFSNRSSACRKLHRLAQSVILLDEVQTIPDHLAVPTLATLSWLAERYRATVVFSTATQPAFQHLDAAVRGIGDTGWQPSEIAPPELGLFDRGRRTCVSWPDLDRPASWSEIASAVSALPRQQALCIVNVKAHARDLMRELRDRGAGCAYHLSTGMCPAHRRAVLRLVRRRLAARLPCLLVSTQCVEAGVDIDFPVVYRALGPLEAIAQAAGRCNRNGSPDVGQVRVFVPEDYAVPSGSYEQATAMTRVLLRQRGADNMDINDPALFDEYYHRLYDLARPQEKRPDLTQAIRRQDFADVARLYRLIDENTINILVPYKRKEYDRLVEAVRATGLVAGWIHRAQPYVVGLYRPKDADPVWTCLERVRVARNVHSDEWFIYTNADDYDRDMGLLPRDAPALWLVS